MDVSLTIEIAIYVLKTSYLTIAIVRHCKGQDNLPKVLGHVNHLMILFDNNIMIQINIMTDSTKVQSFYENN